MWMTYRWLCILDYVQGREHWLSLIRSIGLYRALGALGEWWYIHCVEHILFDSLFFVSTSICMFLMFILWLWISYEGQSLCVIMYPHLLSIDLFVWQLGKSISCPLSLKSYIIDWVEYQDLLWIFDLIMYHIRSIHCICINPWGRPTGMVLEIR